MTGKLYKILNPFWAPPFLTGEEKGGAYYAMIVELIFYGSRVKHCHEKVTL